MRKFSELNVIVPETGFVGDKIKMDRILNREVDVLDYRIETSRYEKGNGKCLYLQIQIGDNKHVVFTGSSVLQRTIEQIPKNEMPFKTIIKKENDRLIFT